MEDLLWQLAHGDEELAHGDKQVAESIRYLICKAAYEGVESRLPLSATDYNEALSAMYTKLMTSRVEETGINNYAGTILPLITGERNESDAWAYTLDFSTAISQMRLVPPDSLTSPDISISHPEVKIPKIPFDGASDDEKVQTSHHVSNCLPKLPQYYQSSNLVPKYPLPIQHPRPPVEAEPCHTRPVKDDAQLDSFRTAREQLILNNAIKNNQPVPPLTVGPGKKSLGPRRGGGKFVSPLAHEANQEGMSNLVADITERVCGGKSTKGKPSDDDLELPRELAHLDHKIVELIINEIMDSDTSMTWDDIAGLQFAKQTIKEVVVLPMLRPDIFKGLRGPPKGLLLFGPPGTGKTLIGKCVASQSKYTFFSISASSLTSKWVGEGEKMVRTLFEVARYKQPAVIFIDEIDSLLTQRSESEHESSRRIKTEFLVQMDGVGCNNEDRVLVIGATNRPQELDEAARRRFVKRLYIPLPEATARTAIIHRLMLKQEVTLADGDLEFVVTQTAGYSGADMANLCKEAALGPVRDIRYEDIETITLDQVRPINSGDFGEALKQVRASVDSSDLDTYLEWNSKFGSWDIHNL